MKTCSKCHVEQELAGYTRCTRNRDGLQAQCRRCQQIRQNNDEDRAKRKLEMRRWIARRPLHLKLRDNIASSLGIPRSEASKVVVHSGTCCAICGKIPGPGERTLCIDHCHTTMLLRGHLCALCNFALGAMQDDPARLRTAAIYLEHPPLAGLGIRATKHNNRVPKSKQP